MRKLPVTTALGWGVIAFGLLLAFVLIPLDTDTWLVEKLRGRYTVGDSLAPTLAAAIITISGCMMLLKHSDDAYHPTRENLKFIGFIAALGIASIVLMRWAGPALTYLAGGEEYRLLRDTIPWKYSGLLTGGVALIFGMISFVEEKLSWRALWIATGAVAALIILYDLPFEDVLLPPNGDV